MRDEKVVVVVVVSSSSAAARCEGAVQEGRGDDERWYVQGGLRRRLVGLGGCLTSRCRVLE